MAEQMNEVVAVDPALQQAALNVTGEYNFHLTNENGVYHSTKINQLAVSKELEAQIETVVNGNPPNYYYLPEIVGKVSGKFAYDADSKKVTLNAANIAGVELIPNPSDEGAQYSFEIDINYNKTFGILNYDNIKLKILDFLKMKGEFEHIDDNKLRNDVKNILDENNKERNLAELTKLFVDREKFTGDKNNAAITIETAVRGYLGKRKAKEQSDIRTKLRLNLQPAAKALIELLDSMLKTKSDAAGGDEPIVEVNGEEYVPGPDSDSMEYIKKLYNKNSAITKEEYNKLEQRYTFLKNKAYRSDEENSEIEAIVQLNGKVRDRNFGSNLTVATIKNGPNFNDFALVTGGSRRTLKRGGKKTRRKTKRSRRRRSGRREKRTSRR